MRGNLLQTLQSLGGIGIFIQSCRVDVEDAQALAQLVPSGLLICVKAAQFMDVVTSIQQVIFLSVERDDALVAVADRQETLDHSERPIDD